jgi:hypothetical protein
MHKLGVKVLCLPHPRAHSPSDPHHRAYHSGWHPLLNIDRSTQSIECTDLAKLDHVRSRLKTLHPANA